MPCLLAALLSAAVAAEPAAPRIADAEAPPERAPEPDAAPEERARLIEELTYLQWPGLPPAASKIYHSERRYALSGFGEVSYNHFLGDKSRASGDIELYNTNLYRFVAYGAWRATPWMVLYAEVFAELYHDGLREWDYEVFPEVFVDLVLAKPFNVRLGWAQVPIGYINNNDEPIMFYSVNRPEVERLIVPSQWIDLGVQVYGKLGDRATWMVHGFQGVEGSELLGASWVRQGRHTRFDFNAPAVAAKLEYSPIDHLDLGVSTLWMESGSRARLEDGAIVRAPTTIHTAYARYLVGETTLMWMGTVGTMADTEGIAALTAREGHDGSQILGRRTFGTYVEVGRDLLPTFRSLAGRPARARKAGKGLLRRDEMKLPLFVRYERLDTHASLAEAFRGSPDLPIYRSNLDVLTMGLNFNPRRSLVLKANYQIRHNRSASAFMPQEGDRVEAGFGFIF
jgi:hypothetical protein